LLLTARAGDPPLLHALRIGRSHRAVALLLVGAFSRYVNNLGEEEVGSNGEAEGGSNGEAEGGMGGMRVGVGKKDAGVLKALRTNLKLAIDHDLARDRSDLAASFMQVLVMSEGERWVAAQAEAVGRELRVARDRAGEGLGVLRAAMHPPAPPTAGHPPAAPTAGHPPAPPTAGHPPASPTAGHPVATARAAVRKFATRELGRAELIASLEDYIGNATVDLLLLGAWGLARDVVGGEGIPTSCFARDDRTYRAFCERLDGIGVWGEDLVGVWGDGEGGEVGVGGEQGEATSRSATKASRPASTATQRPTTATTATDPGARLAAKLPRKLRWQLRVLRAAVGGRRTTYRKKVELLEAVLDGG
ncbi:hypothetical protein HDZ31DRAFT_77629, partial [Schizophyllum fasciatum]